MQADPDAGYAATRWVTNMSALTAYTVQEPSLELRRLCAGCISPERTWSMTPVSGCGRPPSCLLLTSAVACMLHGMGQLRSHSEAVKLHMSSMSRVFTRG